MRRCSLWLTAAQLNYSVDTVYKGSLSGFGKDKEKLRDTKQVTFTSRATITECNYYC